MLMLLLAPAAALIGAALYRLRGGWLRDLTGDKRWWNGSQAMRLIWSIPTAALITALVEPTPIVTTGLALVASIFASMALIGHGAHMTFDRARWFQPGTNRTEGLTVWLPLVFGEPVPSWSDARFVAYNVLGMSVIGVVRNLVALLPLWLTRFPGAADQELSAIAIALLLYTATGALHGPLYWLGWRLRGNSATGELLVGGLSWAALVLIFS